MIQIKYGIDTNSGRQFIVETFVAMTLLTMVTFIAQSAYRFRQTASMVINGIFLVFVLSSFYGLMWWGLPTRRGAARAARSGL